MTRTALPIVRRTALAASLALLAACGRSKPATTPEPAATTQTTPSRALEGLKASPVVVTPAQAVRAGDPMGWAMRLPSREFLRGFDAELEYVLKERGMDTVWRLPTRLLADHRRNPTLGVNPTALSAMPLTGDVKLSIGQRVGDPLLSQLRALVAMHGGRHALVPVEVRFVPEGAAPPGGTPAQGRAVLRLVLVDARAAEITWIGEVRSDATTSPSRAVEATLALRVGDLVAAP